MPYIILLLVFATFVIHSADLTTKSGKTYKNITINKTTVKGLSILHSAGASTIPYQDLPDELRMKYKSEEAKALEFQKNISEKTKRSEERKRKQEIADANNPKLQVVKKALQHINSGSGGISYVKITDHKTFIAFKDNLFPDEDYYTAADAPCLLASRALKNAGFGTSYQTVILVEGTNINDPDNVFYKASALDGELISFHSQTPKNYPRSKAEIERVKRDNDRIEKFKMNQEGNKNYNIFAKTHVSSYDDSVKPVIRAVKSNMKDPSSFAHIKTNTFILSGTTDKFLVRMSFRGKNSFNALVVNKISAIVDMNGNVSNVKNEE